jgi:OOP family OmpA-OmpF porin
VVLASALAVTLSGCATQGGNPDGGINKMCAALGGAVGGGAAAAITLAAGPIGAGVGVGALLGAMACHNRGAATTTTTSVASDTETRPAPIAVAPAPGPVADIDSDGDGVMDTLDRCPNTPAGTKVNAQGCPDLLLSLTGIHFKFDSAAIESNSSEILDRAVTGLNETKGIAVRIEGHCDSTGGETYNQMLSERRANAVKAYLVEHGIAAERLSVVGRGESTPVASNDNEAGRFENRRVEFRVADEATATPATGTDDPLRRQQPDVAE